MFLKIRTLRTSDYFMALQGDGCTWYYISIWQTLLVRNYSLRNSTHCPLDQVPGVTICQAYSMALWPSRHIRCSDNMICVITLFTTFHINILTLAHTIYDVIRAEIISISLRTFLNRWQTLLVVRAKRRLCMSAESKQIASKASWPDKSSVKKKFTSPCFRISTPTHLEWGVRSFFFYPRYSTLVANQPALTISVAFTMFLHWKHPRPGWYIPGTTLL